MSNCQNCGCEVIVMKNVYKSQRRRWKRCTIECCKHCRCDECKFMAKMRLFKFWNEAW